MSKKIILTLTLFYFPLNQLLASEVKKQALEGEGGVHLLIFHTDKKGAITPLAFVHDENNHPSHNHHASTLFWSGTVDMLSNVATSVKQGANNMLQKANKLLGREEKAPEGAFERLNWSIDKGNASLKRKLKRVNENPSTLPLEIRKVGQDVINHVKNHYVGEKAWEVGKASWKIGKAVNQYFNSK